LLRETEERWHGLFAREGRRLECGTLEVADDICVPGARVTEILGVLLDNARVHGHGTVRLRARDLGDAVAFDVIDEGAVDGEADRLFDRGPVDEGPGSGIGLSLARDLAVSLGGRLSLTGRRPVVFTLLVPVRQEEAVPAGGG
jgi:signal transduction histidine kinase